MAELVVIRLTVKLACQLFSSYASDLLETGDVTDEKIRQALLSEFKKIHENFDALRRKELVSAISFLETGFEVLDKDEKTAKEEFRKARDAAQMAFGVVAEATDKILATKILVTSTFHEFNDNIDTAKTLCGKYLHRINNLPAVVQSCKVVFTPVKSFSNKLAGIGGNSKRGCILDGIAEVNKCVFDYFRSMGTNLDTPPVIRFEQYHINPVVDLMLNRRAVKFIEIARSLSGFTSVAMSTKYIFAGLSKITTETPENDIIAINLMTCQISHLIGHNAAVLSLCCNEDYLISSSFDRNILIWDASTLQVTKELAGHTGAIPAICLSDNYLFSGSSDCTVRVWDHANEFECIKTLEVPEYVTKLTCSKTAFLYCLCGTKTIQIWHVRTFTLLHSLTACDQVFNIINSDAGLFLGTKGKSGQAIQCWNLGSLTELAVIPESGMNMAQHYNSPYLICGDEKLKMLSTTSQRLIMEKEIVASKGRFVGKKIKYIWINDVTIYVLCEGVDGSTCIIKY